MKVDISFQNCSATYQKEISLIWAMCSGTEGMSHIHEYSAWCLFSLSRMSEFKSAQGSQLDCHPPRGNALSPETPLSPMFRDANTARPAFSSAPACSQCHLVSEETKQNPSGKRVR